MAGQTSDELLALFDTAKLNARYWAIFVIMSAIIVLEFFDFGVVAFLLAVVGPAWHLTYGQSATILFGGGPVDISEPASVRLCPVVYATHPRLKRALEPIVRLSKPPASA